MSELYTEEYKKQLALKRDLVVLKPLLNNIRKEEDKAINKIKEDKVKIDFTKSILVVSNIQVYKSFSLQGLLSKFNRNTKYSVLDLSQLLDVWYNNSTMIDKSSLLIYDVLIIHGIVNTMSIEAKDIALQELLSTRQTSTKITWIYLEDTNNLDLKELFPRTSKSVNAVYNYNL